MGFHQKPAVKAKKHLGQHFLNDTSIAREIVLALTASYPTGHVLEIGPGMGILTRYLLDEKQLTVHAVDIDKESVQWLHTHYPELGDRLVEGDFLSKTFSIPGSGSCAVIGNFPYNISSQIIFRVLDEHHHIPVLVGMFQKEVAERIGSACRSKDYGILSVLTQLYYRVEYLMTVPAEVFTPPPKVLSGVIRMTAIKGPTEAEKPALYRVVKTAFNQRRKKLRNALGSLQFSDDFLVTSGWVDKRAEELTPEQFLILSRKLISV